MPYRSYLPEQYSALATGIVTVVAPNHSAALVACARSSPRVEYLGAIQGQTSRSAWEGKIALQGAAWRVSVHGPTLVRTRPTKLRLYSF